MKQVIAFVLGATAGTLVTWKILEKKYKQIADEEIEAVREYYRSKDEVYTASILGISNEPVKTYIEEEKVEDEEKTEYNKQVQELDYSQDEDDYTVQLAPAEEEIAPYTIAPDEFGEADGYNTRSWTCYADMVLTDEDGIIVSEPERIIGDALAYFGEYEDDSVYVRNENNECDYEILKHDKTYDEIRARLG